MQWEFTYVDLWLGKKKTPDALTQQEAYIAKLGKEGWEPVGQVQFKYHDVYGTLTNVQQLMFKRPIT